MFQRDFGCRTDVGLRFRGASGQARCESFGNPQRRAGLHANVLLGLSNPILDSVFVATQAYLSIKIGDEPEMTPRQQLVAVRYAYRTQTANEALLSLSAAPNSVNSGSIIDGTIQLVDIGQNGASSGQTLKWNGHAWAVANDETSGDSRWVVADSVLFTNKYWGLARGAAGNALYGSAGYTMANFGVACTTGHAGTDEMSATVGGGRLPREDPRKGSTRMAGGASPWACAYFPHPVAVSPWADTLVARFWAILKNRCRTQRVRGTESGEDRSTQAPKSKPTRWVGYRTSLTPCRAK